MPCLVQRRHQPVFIDIRHDTVDGILACGVDNREFLAKVAEQRAEESEGVGDDKINTLLVAVITYGKLDFERSVRKNDDLVLVELG